MAGYLSSWPSTTITQVKEPVLTEKAKKSEFHRFVSYVALGALALFGFSELID